MAALLAYLVVRGSSPGPLFLDVQGQPFLKAKFIARIRDIIEPAGYPTWQFAWHSFRIGTATTAAQAGIEHSMIQALGRWNSVASLAYIKTPKEKLIAVSS